MLILRGVRHRASRLRSTYDILLFIDDVDAATCDRETTSFFRRLPTQRSCLLKKKLTEGVVWVVKEFVEVR